jgi:hypothetical protein
VDNNYLDLGMSKSGFIHILHSGRLNSISTTTGHDPMPYVRAAAALGSGSRTAPPPDLSSSGGVA